MSNTLNAVLDRLRAFGNDKLSELDARCEEHRGWLRSAVEEVARQIAELGPAAKKQRLDGSGAAKLTAAQQVGGARRQQLLPQRACSMQATGAWFLSISRPALRD